MKETRPYVQRARADAKAQTRERILRAVVDHAEETFDLDPTLDVIAARAGVSVQTILRHFGSRDGLFDAAVERGSDAYTDERAVPVGDIAEAVRTIVSHYERRGDFVIRMLAREHHDQRVQQIVGPGKASHRQWVTDVFAPMLPSDATAREAQIDVLVVATDVYTWKLLRRDRELSPDVVASRMEQLVSAVLTNQGGAG